jgi:hypothetical protein
MMHPPDTAVKQSHTEQEVWRACSSRPPGATQHPEQRNERRVCVQGLHHYTESPAVLLLNRSVQISAAVGACGTNHPTGPVG